MWRRGKPNPHAKVDGLTGWVATRLEFEAHERAGRRWDEAHELGAAEMGYIISSVVPPALLADTRKATSALEMCKALAGRDRRASWDGEVDYDDMLAFYTEYFSEGESLVDESSQNTKNSELLCRFFGVERPLEAGMPTDLLYHERVYLPSAGELLTHYGQGLSWRVGDQRLSAG